jgi:hypothetical protein
MTGMNHGRGTESESIALSLGESSVGWLHRPARLTQIDRRHNVLAGGAQLIVNPARRKRR